MINKGQADTTEDLMIQGLLSNYLRLRSTGAAATDNDSAQRHLDEDALNAFVEGSLTERESAPILSHLVDCSFCRHVTAELVKLDFAFAGEEIQTPAAQQQSQPSSISDVLNNLLSRLFGNSDSAAVMAHQEPEEEKKESDSEKAELSKEKKES